MFDEIFPYLKQIFKLETLSLRHWTEVRDGWEVIHRIQVRSYWIAQTSWYPFKYRNSIEIMPPIVACIRTNHWKRAALILLPEIYFPSPLLSSPKLMPPIDITDEEDTVTPALKSVNLFPQEPNNVLPERESDFKVKFETDLTAGEFSAKHMFSKNQDLNNLGRAIIHFVDKLCALYADKELNNLLL